MASARPEYAIVVAVVGVFLAIGVPALDRGQTLIGWACIAVAAAVASVAAISAWRARR